MRRYWGLLAVAATACAGEPYDEGDVRPGVDEITQVAAPLVSADVNHFELAFHWAPVHTQAINSNQDFIRQFNFDSDFKGTNNADNQGSFSLEAGVYYAVAESTSHFFIYYGFFHPNDEDTGACDTSHENDMESMMVIVRKDGTAFGRIDGIVAAAHGHYFEYANDSRITRGPRSPHGLRPMQLAPLRSPETHQRPFTYQEPRGHGLYHCGEIGEEIDDGVFSCAFTTANLPNCNTLNFTRIRYVPSRGFAQASATPPSGQALEVQYRLIDLTAISGLFARRFNINTFSNFTAAFPTNFAGDGGNKASAPWADFRLDGAIPPNPAGFVSGFFNFGGGLTPPSTSYIRHDFADGGNVCTSFGKPFTNSPVSSACVQSVCGADSFCCTTAWDDICVNQAMACLPTGCSNCAHATSVTGTALQHSCSQCVADVCNRDPFCCTTSWDNTCVSEARICGFRYEVQQQDRGWLGPCASGDACGVTGTGQRLEAMRLYDPPGGGTICYQAHVQDGGWQPEVCSGIMAGTQGQSRRMEAVRIRLFGAPAGDRVCYTATVPGVSQGEVCDGADAGTIGQSRRIESLRVRIVKP